LITGINRTRWCISREFLLAKGYKVHGVNAALRHSTPIESIILSGSSRKDLRLELHYGDLTDSTNLIRIIQEVQPDEIYNLAAQSHVAVSFETPGYNGELRRLGSLRVLEASVFWTRKQDRFIRRHFEMFGKVQEIRNGKLRRSNPPLAVRSAKVYAYWITVNYASVWLLPATASCSITNRRCEGDTFVSRKITAR